MFRVKSKIIITQKTQIVGEPARNLVLKFDFCNEISCTDSWRDFTNRGAVILPKNINAIDDKTGQTYPLSGFNLSIGGAKNPLIMRGDAIQMDYYYVYYENGVAKTEGTEDLTNDTHLFNGYISEVLSKKPIEFKVEDLFWKLKQLPAPTKTYPATISLHQIIEDLVKPCDVPIKVSSIQNTTFGEFRVGNETVAEVLGRLRKTYHFESYFRGNTLYSGVIIYDPAIAKERTFKFQENIIQDDLTYKRKEDLVLSILASTSTDEETGKLTKDGAKKTKKKRIEVLLTLKNGSDEPIIFEKKEGQDYPPNTGGERMTLSYPMARDKSELIRLATIEIKKYYYSGFKGKFTTFGLPFTKTGDNINIIDDILPERNGMYKCKSVEYVCGMNGIRQKIQLDYLIPTK